MTATIFYYLKYRSIQLSHSFQTFKMKLQLAELTPNKTRRAQCANWLLYYREELFGYTLEELKEKRRVKQEEEEAEKQRVLKETGRNLDDEWKYPAKEIF